MRARNNVIQGRLDSGSGPGMTEKPGSGSGAGSGSAALGWTALIGAGKGD